VDAQDAGRPAAQLCEEQLNAEKLHLNLGSADVWTDRVELEGTTVVIEYRAPSETIVSFEELKAAGIDNPQSLTSARSTRACRSIARCLRQSWRDCATGFDPGDLADYNYFYYFDPGKAGCTLPIADATYTIKSLLPPSSTYPSTIACAPTAR